MEGLAQLTCRRCGRAPGGRLIHGRCVRCRALELMDGFDDELSGHARRVTAVAMHIADELEISAEVRRDIELGGLLHDIGKLAIPAAILAKAGPLEGDEIEVMRTHVTEGERLASGLEELPESVPLVVRASHERWDGGGYPDGLEGDAIPLAARIVACADAFDAMTSSRSYRPALEIGLALDIVREEAGRQFDPVVASALVAAVSKWELELSAEPIASAFDVTLRRLRREHPPATQRAQA